MLAVLPLVFFLLCLATIGASRPRLRLGELGRLDASLLSAVATGLWAVAGTELLGLLGLFAFWPMLVWWLGGAAALGVYAWQRPERWIPWLTARLRLSHVEWGLLAVVGLVMLVAATVAVLAPPTNYDSQTYHLPRQLLWIQQQSLAHFPTNSLRQVFMPPMAEILQANLALLGGSDRLVNCVQLLALALTSGAVVLIARELGASRFGQLLSAVFLVTLPMAFLEASGTKNDLVLALWVTTFALWTLRVFTRRECSVVQALMMGTTLGFVLYTKGTGGLFTGAICLVFGVGVLRARHWRGLLLGLVVVFSAASVNAGHWTRNALMFNHFLGPQTKENEGSEHYLNQELAARYVASNLVRNGALHLGTWKDSWNEWVQQKAEQLHERLGVAPGDPATTYKGHRFKVQYRPASEDRAGAPLHVLFGLLALLIAPFWPSGRRRIAWLYIPLIPIGIVAFCAVLKWQPWHARLHLPLFAMMAPAVGLVFGRRPVAWASPVLVLAMLAWLAPSLKHGGRPLYGDGNIFVTERDELRYSWLKSWYEPTREVVEYIGEAKPKSVGLRLGYNSYYYPLMRMIKDKLDGDVEFVSFNPKKVSNRADKVVDPDLVIGVGRPPPEVLAAGRSIGEVYAAVAFFDRYTVFARRTQLPDLKSRLDEHPFFGWKRRYGMSGPREGPQVGRAQIRLEYRAARAGTLDLVLECRHESGRAASLEFEAGQSKSRQVVDIPPTKGWVRRRLAITTDEGNQTVTIRGARNMLFRALRLEPHRAPALGGTR